MSLLTASSTEASPEQFLLQMGRVFARFDQRTQDSGNLSYGVEVSGQRYFVKTPGPPTASAHLNHDQRVYWLCNAADLAGAVTTPCLPRLHNVVESAHGPMLVYEWLDGELVGVPRERRTDPDSAFVRFKRLPGLELVEALDTIFQVHLTLAAQGWIASDFYDGAVMYDFARRRVFLIDLDMYRRGPFRNDMGRMFGSTRFMAPEEFQLDALIDERTTTFTMGRCVSVLMESRIGVGSSLARFVGRACAAEPSDRYASMSEFCSAWSEAKPSVTMRDDAG